MIVNRLFAVALALVLLVVVPAGCASNDEGAAPTETAAGTGGNGDTGGTQTLGEGLQDAKAQLCPELVDLTADLTEVSASGTAAGQDVLERLAAAADAVGAAASALTTAGAEDAATAAEDLSSSLESLSTSDGEDARALAGEAADEAQQLTDALQCP